MKLFQKISIFIAFACGSAVYGQTALTQSTLTGTITQGTRALALASCTGISANQLTGSSSFLYIDRELLAVNSMTTTSPCFVQVAPRGSAGTKAFPHKTGSTVLIGPAAAFHSFDMSGSCTAGSGNFQYAPTINQNNGNQYFCSSVTSTVVAGFGNTDFYAPVGPTAAVASAAGLITPSGPLFHVTGTAAITGFNIPVGFYVQGTGSPNAFCIIPDAIFTVTATNNVALASTAVVKKPLCYTYDANTALLYPSY